MSPKRNTFNLNSKAFAFAVIVYSWKSTLALIGDVILILGTYVLHSELLGAVNSNI